MAIHIHIHQCRTHDAVKHDPHSGQFTSGEGGSGAGEQKKSSPPAYFSKAHKLASSKGFSYHGENERGHHVWKKEDGKELSVGKGGIGRQTGSYVARLKTGPNTEKADSDPTWPENAIRRVFRKAGI